MPDIGNAFLQKLQNTPHQDRIKPIKKDSAGGKKEQLLADRDAYLQLLLTQLKNQNPQSPTDTNQMTQNIVAISQAEQSITTNEHLEKLVNMQELAHKSSIVNYIGKEVEYDNSRQPLEFGEAKFVYELPKNAERMKISIVDSQGHVVRTQGSDRNMRSEGIHEFIWDGRDNAGKKLNEGTYKIEIEAVTDNGTPIHAITTIRSKVEGIMEEYGKFDLLLSNKNKIGLDRLMGIYAESDKEERSEQKSQVDISNLIENLNNLNVN